MRRKQRLRLLRATKPQNNGGNCWLFGLSEQGERSAYKKNIIVCCSKSLRKLLSKYKIAIAFPFKVLLTWVVLPLCGKPFFRRSHRSSEGCASFCPTVAIDRKSFFVNFGKSGICAKKTGGDARPHRQACRKNAVNHILGTHTAAGKNWLAFSLFFYLKKAKRYLTNLQK